MNQTHSDAPRPSHAERARTLAEAARHATLSTIGARLDGAPHGSLVLFCMDNAARPILLLSDLATHTKNLERDGRCSLLLTESGPSDDDAGEMAGTLLSRPRLTLVGTASRAPEDAQRPLGEVFVEHHPSAEVYAEFGDFAIWRVEVEAVRWIAGFGSMSWVTADDWQSAAPDPIAPHAAGIIEHMNDDHADAMLAYARAFASAPDTSEARMTGVDRLGFDMELETGSGPRRARLAFEPPVESPKDVRRALVRMVGAARQQLDEA